MARYTGPKHRLARQVGINVIEKNSRSLERRIMTPPGVHGKKRKRKLSEYGIQLREKQKLKRIYGLMEKQFRNYVQKAENTKGNSTEALVQQLEGRLDNIVYRLGFANSRFQARQFVSHGHILVNGKKLNIPSYQLNVGDVVVISQKLLQNNVLLSDSIVAGGEIVAYLERTGAAGKFVREPKQDEVSNPVDYQVVIEYYSR